MDNFNITESVLKINKPLAYMGNTDGVVLHGIAIFAYYLIMRLLLKTVLTYLYFVNRNRLIPITQQMEAPGIELLVEHCVIANYLMAPKHLIDASMVWLCADLLQVYYLQWFAGLILLSAVVKMSTIIGYSVSIAMLGQLVTLKDNMPADEYTACVNYYTPPLLIRRRRQIHA